jgi:hypothetical protein
MKVVRLKFVLLWEKGAYSTETNLIGDITDFAQIRLRLQTGSNAQKSHNALYK